MIIPTVLARNKKEFTERFNKLTTFSKNIQIDFMDGLFVPAKTPSLPKELNLKKYKINFEAHLMYNRPLTHLKKLKAKDFKKIIFHIESKSNPEKTTTEIRKLKMSPWLALNPKTPLKKITPFLPGVDGILFMGVYPGREHQHFIPKVYEKIKSLRKLNKKIKIQVDGGANEKTIPKLAKLGVDYINSGSYVSEAKNPMAALKKLNALFEKNKQ